MAKLKKKSERRVPRRLFKRSRVRLVVIIGLVFVVGFASWAIYRLSAHAAGSSLGYVTCHAGGCYNNERRTGPYSVGEVLTYSGYARGTLTQAEQHSFAINLQAGSGNQIKLLSFDCLACSSVNVPQTNLPYNFAGTFIFPARTYNDERIFTLTFRIDALNTESPVLYGLMNAGNFYNGSIAGFTRDMPTNTPATPVEESPNVNPVNPARNNTTGDSQANDLNSSSGSGGTSASTQSIHPSTLPGNSLQGEQKQPEIVPSPFFDGKEYTPGSSAGASTGAINVSDAIFGNWSYIVASIIVIGAVAGTFYWYRWHKK